MNLKELLENLILVINLKRLLNIIKKIEIQHGYHASVCIPGC